MSMKQIFSAEVGGTAFVVRIVDDTPVYSVDGSPVASLNAFLQQAAQAFGGDLFRDGTVNDNALEHFGSLANPSISINDDATKVSIGGAAVSGSFQATFTDAGDNAAGFRAFAKDLLGKETFTKVYQGYERLDGDGRRIVVEQRDDDIFAVRNPGTTNESLQLADEFVFKVSGAGVSGVETFVTKDAFATYLGVESGGTRISNGGVSERYTGNQLSIKDGPNGEDTRVDFGSHQVGGAERWDFASAEDALAFRNLVDEYLTL